MHRPNLDIDDRRRFERETPVGIIRVTRAVSAIPIDGARIVNVSSGGVALIVAEPVAVGERLSFYTHRDHPPILAEVVACEKHEAGGLVVRCRCLMGGFDV